MRLAKLLALFGVALLVSAGCGSEAEALIDRDMTEARTAVGP